MYVSTREKIILSAVELFVSQGVDKTTTREIAANAAVAEGSIYRYFSSKEELAWQIFHEHHLYMAGELIECIKDKKTIEEKISSLVKCFLKLADDNWMMFSYYLTSQHTHMNKISSEELTPYKVVSNVIKNAENDDEIKCENTTLMTAMVMGSVHQIATNKVYGRMDGALIKHHRLVSEIISNMLLPNRTEK